MAKRYTPFRSQFSRDLWTDGLRKWLSDNGLENSYVRDLDGFITTDTVADTEDRRFELTKSFQTVAFIEHKAESEITFKAITSSTIDSSSLRYSLESLAYKSECIEIGQQELSDYAPEKVYALFITEQKQGDCQGLSSEPIYRAGLVRMKDEKISIEPFYDGELFDRIGLYHLISVLR